MFRKLTLLLATALLALPLLAADLGIYKEWASSPAAYFMTFDERAAWTQLQTEAEAAAFVKTYTEARGGEKFTAELSKRVQMADKYLTIGKLPGSQTTRGKIVILLGPPKSMDVHLKPTKAGRTATNAMSMSAAGGDARMSADDVAEVSAREDMAGDSGIRIYTFAYENLTVPVEVNATSGKDRIRDRKANANLERAFELAAKASLVVK